MNQVQVINRHQIISVNISVDVDNKYSITNVSDSIELQPLKLTQELNFFHTVLDMSYILKSKTIIADLVLKELLEHYRKPLNGYN